jgi:tetratricopeptide (TPR) repeat protein
MNGPSKDVSRTLRHALALGASEPRKALAELDSGLEKARSEGDAQGLSSLARHAAIFCVHLGDARRALGYYEEAQRFEGEDPYLYVASGNLRRELGELNEAEAAFRRVLGLALQQSDADLVTLARYVLEQTENERSR